MTARAIIKEAELKRMAKIAKLDGVVVESEKKDGTIFRVFPHIPDNHRVEKDTIPDDFSLL